jgi:hypothetical protein
MTCSGARKWLAHCWLSTAGRLSQVGLYRHMGCKAHQMVPGYGTTLLKREEVCVLSSLFPHAVLSAGSNLLGPIYHMAKQLHGRYMRRVTYVHNRIAL